MPPVLLEKLFLNQKVSSNEQGQKPLWSTIMAFILVVIRAIAISIITDHAKLAIPVLAEKVVWLSSRFLLTKKVVVKEVPRNDFYDEWCSYINEARDNNIKQILLAFGCMVAALSMSFGNSQIRIRVNDFTLFFFISLMVMIPLSFLAYKVYVTNNPFIENNVIPEETENGRNSHDVMEKQETKGITEPASSDEEDDNKENLPEMTLVFSKDSDENFKDIASLVTLKNEKSLTFISVNRRSLGSAIDRLDIDNLEGVYYHKMMQENIVDNQEYLEALSLTPIESVILMDFPNRSLIDEIDYQVLMGKIQPDFNKHVDMNTVNQDDAVQSDLYSGVDFGLGADNHPHEKNQDLNSPVGIFLGKQAVTEVTTGTAPETPVETPSTPPEVTDTVIEVGKHFFQNVKFFSGETKFFSMIYLSVIYLSAILFGLYYRRRVSIERCF